jgi:hypothetical protein
MCLDPGVSFMQIGCLFGVMTAAAIAVHPATAQEAGAKRVGIILQGGPWYAVVEGLREGLNQSGYVEGKQYVLDIRDTHGDLKAAEEAARNLEEQKVHLIYTAATSVYRHEKGEKQQMPKRHGMRLVSMRSRNRAMIASFKGQHDGCRSTIPKRHL